MCRFGVRLLRLCRYYIERLSYRHGDTRGCYVLNAYCRLYSKANRRVPVCTLASLLACVMGFMLAAGPFFGFGLTVYFEYAVIELAIGPFLIMIGDVDAISASKDDDY